MIDELSLASSLLDNALDRYMKACANIRNHYRQNGSFSVIPLELSQRVASEASMLGGRELKLREARAKINWARNFSTHLVPIHLLPPEVLARIFQFALGPNNIGNMHRHPRLKRTKNRNTISSDLLSHVCSYWRQVALSSPHLWTRVDLAPCQEVSNGLLPRAATFAQRAGSMLVDIHVTDPIREWPVSANLDHFIRAFAPRIRSLDLRIYQTTRTNVYRDTLSACFSYCVPGTFTQLIATREPDGIVPSYVFFDLPDSGIPEHGLGFHQRLDTRANETILLSITTMRLQSFYPFWTSRAYHGLVELRLTSRASGVPISESHLRGILRASPCLRILEFALDLVDRLPEGSVAPVQLDCLEVLNLCVMYPHLILNFLRIIDPGSHPLQLSLSSADDVQLPFNSLGAHSPFFSHANITTLYVDDFDKDEVTVILCLCPHLQTLALDGCGALSEPESDVLISHRQLHSLYLVWCDVVLDVFTHLFDLPALKNLVLYRCTFYQNGDTHDEDPLDERQVQLELPGIDPVISVVGSDMPNPIEGWELFDSDS